MTENIPPLYYTNDMQDFLNKLRDSGEINMLGAVPYLQEEFILERNDAKECLQFWMDEKKREANNEA